MAVKSKIDISDGKQHFRKQSKIIIIDCKHPQFHFHNNFFSLKKTRENRVKYFMINQKFKFVAVLSFYTA